MDPLTHTLAGVSLAQTRVARGPLATATCLIGANLPDVDAATYFLEGDFSLGGVGLTAFSQWWCYHRFSPG